MKSSFRYSVLTIALASLAAPAAFGAGTGTQSGSTSSTTTSETTQSADQGEIQESEMSGTTSGAASGTTSPTTGSSMPSTESSDQPMTGSGTTTGSSAGTATGSGAMASDIGTRYQVVDFRQGSSEIAQSDRQKLRTLIDNAKAKGQISQLHVAVWSDKQFPREGSLPKADRDLATARVDKLQTYLRDTLSVSDIQAHNMAERASWVARNFHMGDAELKSMFSQRGAEAPVTNEEFQVIKQMGGPGKAVVVIQMSDSMSGTSSDASGTTSGTSSGATSGGEMKKDMKKDKKMDRQDSSGSSY